MGPNRNKSRTTWQTWQFLATGVLSLSIQQCSGIEGDLIGGDPVAVVVGIAVGVGVAVGFFY